jgi:hypothetical protein
LAGPKNDLNESRAALGFAKAGLFLGGNPDSSIVMNLGGTAPGSRPRIELDRQLLRFQVQGVERFGDPGATIC